MAFLGMGLGKDNSPHRLRALHVKDKLPQLAVTGIAPALASESARDARGGGGARASELWDQFEPSPPETARSAPSGSEKSRWLDHAGEVRPRALNIDASCSPERRTSPVATLSA